MLKIAICDDQPKELTMMQSYITEYLTAYGLSAEVKQYTHPDDLLHQLQADCFHLYLLDIVMPMVNGLELGKEIRCFDREAQIIYITTEPQYALQAYSVNPINYLIKPVDKHQLFDTLTLAISKIDLSEEQTLAVKTADSIRVLKPSDILFCEYKNHVALYILTGGEELVSRTIRESFADYIKPLLEKPYFLTCHKAFVVNMRYIEEFAKDSFTLRGGKIVPISAKQYIAVRDSYTDYLMAKERQK
ncbi:LytTR family transcriptional regulator [Sporanaerobium hydrogeniformans]|uniref:LytTR family transcriptional regulator n=1 Tax=Sporanaerobium hydrogeniformans TaxID=3072179 RepID=A0AC61DCA5_9FIRM|nr:LytTR family DNA-binding domain-containing protein [Sporanaerobium hydrogeniformans]PHV70919.1 LytTR family transcriptional regulator [Sporanaerobium hydrogeniformans]